MVYLIDDTSSQRNLRAQLQSAFSSLLTSYSNPRYQVRVAALVHGEPGRAYAGNSSARYINSLGRYPRSPDLLGGFKAPKDISPRTATAVINTLTLTAGKEFLYVGINMARKMIETECNPPTRTPAATPTPTPRPQCHRKVIVVLGDGRPGYSERTYYYNNSLYGPGPHEEFPEKLLDQVKNAEIELHTFCLGAACSHQIIRSWYSRFYYDKPTCPTQFPLFVTTPDPASHTCTGYTGADIMKKLAERSYNGGKYYN